MIKQVVRIVFVASLVAGAFVAGCSDDPAVTPLPKDPITLEIKNGTWDITETVWFTGHDSCVARGTEMLDTTDVICNITYGTESGPFGVECELADSVGGAPDSVEFDCTITADLGICVLFLDIVGSGKVDSTSFTLTTSLIERIVAKEGEDPAECDRFFGSSLDPCTLWVATTGTWVSSDGDSLCAPDAKGVSLQSLVSGIVAGKTHP